MRSRNLTPIGIDFDYNEFRAVQFDRAQSIAAAATIPRQGARKLVPSIEELDEFAKVLAQRGCMGNQVALAVPKDTSSFHLLSLPPQSSGAPIAQLALIEAQRSGAHKSKDLQIGFWTLPNQDGSAKKNSPYYTVASETDALDDLVDRFEAVGYLPISIEPMETALTRAGAYHKEFAKDSIHAIVDFGWDHSSVVITVGHTPVYARKIEIGAGRFRRQLIDDHAMPTDSMNALLNPKLSLSVRDHQSERQNSRANRIRSILLTPMLSELTNQLDTALTYVSQQHRFIPFGIVFRSGYFSSLDQVAHSIAHRTGMPTLELPTPMLNVDMANSNISEFEALVSPRLNIAAGLALGAAQRSMKGAA